MTLVRNVPLKRNFASIAYAVIAFHRQGTRISKISVSRLLGTKEHFTGYLVNFTVTSATLLPRYSAVFKSLSLGVSSELAFSE